jgi:hypothetical protein
MEVEEGREPGEVEEFKEVEDAEEADSAPDSRLARKVTNFGMACGRHYTPRRIQSEPFNRAFQSSSLPPEFSRGMWIPFILISFCCNAWFTIPN